MGEWKPDTRWGNLGLWWSLPFRHYGLKTPWGNLIVKPWRARLYSERHGLKPHIRLAGLCVTWVRLRAPSHPLGKGGS